MNRSTLPRLLAATVALTGCLPMAEAADDAFAKDLHATLALNGKPCDEVIETKRNGDSDYIASCKDGNRYRVFVNAEGRVIVEKL